MALHEGFSKPATFWPNAAEFAQDTKRIVILPAQVEETNGEVIAGFRPDAQELRVNAASEGIEVELYAPDGARLGVYREHAADWILPTVLGIPISLATQLLANLIQTRIDEWRERGAAGPEPEVRCGLAEIEDGNLRVRDLEGPAGEVRDILRELAENAASVRENDGEDAD
jgi:hypothetical protein